MNKIIPVLLLALLSLGFNYAVSPKSYNMFHIGRSKDENIIKYDVNLSASGKIDKENPIKIYWVKKTDGDKIASLSYVQRNLAYGVSYSLKSETEVKFQFVSYKKKTFHVKKTKGGTYKTMTTVDSKNVEVKKIFIQIDGGSFMLPKISYVKLYWRDPVTGTEDIETIKP